MTAELRTVAADRLRARLALYDWSGQSPSRRAALEAFLELANKNGMQAVTMRMLGRELNIKAPSLYAHFPNGRDEIIAESLRWQFWKFGVALLAELDDAGTDLDADTYWSVMVRVHVTRQLRLVESDLWDLLVRTDAIVHFLPPEVRAEARTWIELHEDMFRAVARDLGESEVDERVQLVMTLLEGATRWAPRDPDDRTLERAVDRAVAVSRMLLRTPASAGQHLPD
ncbi:TetR/AcrR family transcriptional regulator [Curtobacterium albidum]|uniref:TetR/AcrR family transcriptional regulator n=1 Tax=Curtobacterium citreum TaxID=2036 RepID=A0A850DRE0_9MICO|nr:TetR/AcrR family transcriptional regulator [Curtobacterium albidum]NUU27199.1 TetR/AcrR family transcriptional regulator [Curtobacterium albidum]